MSVRSIPKNSRSLTGKIIDSRRHTAVAFESALERDLYVLLDFDPSVAHFEEQPVTIAYQDPVGVNRSYTPDVLVHYIPALRGQWAHRSVLYEIKYRDDLRTHWHEYRAKFQAARRYARSQGWVFQLITEREIRTPYLKNVKFLRQYRDRRFDSGDGHQMLAILAERGETEPETLLALLSSDRWERARLLPVLWRLIAIRQVGADLTVPLTMSSRIWSCAPIEEGRDERRH
jgi:TnsA endonuclease N terminal/TnsA endonuclease C terminal